MGENQDRQISGANSPIERDAGAGVTDARDDSAVNVAFRPPKEIIAAAPERESRSRRENLKADVANVITAKILSGELRAGQRIDQDALASELEVSRLPVREAIIMLENVGFVTSISHRGSYVSTITPEDILDHYEIFGMAAGLAARHAASILTDEELAKLEALYFAMHRKSSPDNLADLNFQFHRLINSKSSNRLKAHLRSLRRAMPMRLLLLSDVFSPEADAHHRAIVDALMARDEDMAAETTAIHLRASGTFTVSELRNSGFWDETL
jgi:DNA-binding GntR family transcriptional regulator